MRDNILAGIPHRSSVILQINEPQKGSNIIEMKKTTWPCMVRRLLQSLNH